MLLIIFSCADWTLVYLIWKTICSDTLSIFNLVFYYCINRVLYGFIDLYQRYDLQMFSLFLWLVFLLSSKCPSKHKHFQFLWSPAYLFFAFGCLCFWCHISETITQSKIMKIYTYVFFEEFYNGSSLFRSLVILN